MSISTIFIRHSLAITIACLIGASAPPVTAASGIDDAISALNGKDYVNAFVDLVPAADGGNVEAQFRLGILYLEGRGTSRNTSNALTWLRRAAAAEHVEAQYRLGDYLISQHDGIVPTPEDVKEGMQWLLLASGARHREALYRLALVYFALPDTVSQQAAAVDALVKSAELGQPAAQFKLAGLYVSSYRDLVPRDMSKAARWYGLAARSGHRDAQFTYAYMLDQGSGIPRDQKAAAFWYEKAANSGLTAAQNNLALLYLYGRGVSRDPVEAYIWYTVAATHGSEDAVKGLAKVTKMLSPIAISKARSRLYEKMSQFNGLSENQLAYTPDQPAQDKPKIDGQVQR